MSSRAGWRAAALAAALALAFSASAPGPEALCAQGAEPAGIEVVLDASGSMGGVLGEVEKMVLAKEFLRALRDGLADDGGGPRLALRVYGARSHHLRRDCQDTARLVGAGDPPEVWEAALAGVNPQGVSPLALALERAVAGNATTFVLVTDGAGNCGGDACAGWREVVAGAAGNRDARLHVVALDPEPAELDRLRCLSRAGSGSLTVLSDPGEVVPAGGRLALILLNQGTLDVRLTIGADEPFPAPVRVLRPLTRDPVARLTAGRPRAVPAGIYSVEVETVPAIAFDRVLVLPGETVTLENSDFGRLEVEIPDRTGDPPSSVIVRPSGSGSEYRAGAAGEPLILGAGVYDLSVDLGDSVAVREAVRVQSGSTTRIVFGGSGTLEVVAAGFTDPPATIAVVYGGGRADTVAVGGSLALPAGRYRLVVQTLPIYVTEDVVVEAGRRSLTVIPDTGILRIDLFGPDGLTTEPRIQVREPLTNELYGSIASGQRALTMAGTYRLELPGVPPRSIDGVSVIAGDERIVVRRGLARVVLAAPQPRGGALRLELLDVGGRPLASATGAEPEILAWPGTYRARVWRGPDLLYEGEISVAPGESARIDWRPR